MMYLFSAVQEGVVKSRCVWADKPHVGGVVRIGCSSFPGLKSHGPHTTLWKAKIRLRGLHQLLKNGCTYLWEGPDVKARLKG